MIRITNRILVWPVVFCALPLLEAAKPKPPDKAATPDAASVLIVVNGAVPPMEGTEGMGASEWVGAYYAEKRGIPKRNILRLDLRGTENPLAWDSWHINWDRFDQEIRRPILKKLEDLEKDQQAPIRYIVPTWGIPSHINNVPATSSDGLSADAFLAALQSGQTRAVPNPYRNKNVHFDEWENPGGWRMYLVTRLDGPSPKIAAGLVDKAMRAEKSVDLNQGIAYIDARGLACCDGYYQADQSMYRMRTLAAEFGVRAAFDERQELIEQAPEAMWAWGWYGSPTDAYRFLEGAVGAQLTSYTAGSLRAPYQGNWVEHWLRNGITATWGATAEPTTNGYAKGDDFFRAFWSGYNFAESSYLAAPFLNHTMVFVGDPLYAPIAFRRTEPRLASTPVVDAASGEPPLAPGSLATVRGHYLAACTAVAPGGETLPVELCQASVLFNGQAAGLLYASPAQINLLVPRSLVPGQTITVTVQRQDGGQQSVELAAADWKPAAPSPFVVQSADGEWVAAVTHPDGRLCDSSAPLEAGGIGVLYASGLGPLDTVLANANVSPADPIAQVKAPVELYINNTLQPVAIAALSPGSFGLYQVNFQMQAGTPVYSDAPNRLYLRTAGTESPATPIALNRADGN